MHPEGMQPPALQLSGLAKRFGETTAVEHLCDRVGVIAKAAWSPPGPWTGPRPRVAGGRLLQDPSRSVDLVAALMLGWLIGWVMGPIWSLARAWASAGQG